MYFYFVFSALGPSKRCYINTFLLFLLLLINKRNVQLQLLTILADVPRMSRWADASVESHQVDASSSKQTRHTLTLIDIWGRKATSKWEKKKWIKLPQSFLFNSTFISSIFLFSSTFISILVKIEPNKETNTQQLFKLSSQPKTTSYRPQAIIFKKWAINPVAKHHAPQATTILTCFTILASESGWTVTCVISPYIGALRTVTTRVVTTLIDIYNKKKKNINIHIYH